ncbi:proteasome endopeptidase complex, beta subunit [Suhomyces tanzawaensis NRRL Y-17324]|uniref:Proteasome subunit beta n=1 Tax=Suhomyces tanzawaensis NRRL Y-17324 TaxID=984487 RepID=A0A1E4SHY6_9ASCO|nr:proteasome endopeptidase complex, beta subunit [Suhomyces tanzawaensis NRRL Y-17324]ODV79129.1 proteasome endopeptidase complex, beta subunit [Suhomyces tanzawaensis NRRL Y-17324]
MNHDPFLWGRPSNDTYGAYNHAIAQASVQEATHDQLDQFPKKHTQQPIITGTSVIALKYKDGIIMAADTMGSYGSLMRFNNIERLFRVGKETVVGISGDISDMQQLHRILNELETDEEVYDNDGGHNLRAPHVHEYLTRILYNRRSKMDPLWNAVLVGGFNDDGSPFLKYVDLLGVAYGSSTLATGFGNHLAIPLLRQLIPNDTDYVNVTEEQAKKVVMDCMRVLFYRDARSFDKFSMVTIKDGGKGFDFEKNIKIDNQSWRFARDIKGYGSKQE